MVSTLHQKYNKQVVDFVGHFKKRKIKINAENKEYALAA